MTVGGESGRFLGVPYNPGRDALPARPEVVVVQGKSQAVAALGGITCLVASTTPGGQQNWLVRRITVQGSAAVKCYIFIGTDISLSNLVNGTNSGDLDEDDVNSPIFVPNGQALSAVWLNSDPAGTALLRLEYVVM